MIKVPAVRSIRFGLALVSAAAGLTAQTNVLSANYNNARTNTALTEAALTPSTVKQHVFGKVAAVPVDGQVYAQPLYVTGLQLAGAARNIVYIATMNNSVYAIDADTLTPLWKVNLGPPVPSAVLIFEDVQPQVGILSTPAIDLARQAIYVVTDTLQDQGPVFQLHALSLLDGHEILNGPAVIAASVPGTAIDANAGNVQFDPSLHLQRPGLALANGLVYLAFGSHADAGQYHGWLLAYSQANVQQQVAAFNATPDGNRGGIWQAGRAPAVDPVGNIYIGAANGDYNGTRNFAGSILKLKGQDLSILDWFTPPNFQDLSDNDLDVGSTGAMLAPGTTLLLAGDKAGSLYSMDTNDMGHVQGGTVIFTASPASIFNFALWNSASGYRLYQHDMNGALKAYPVNATGIVQAPASQNSTVIDVPYDGLVVSANGTANGVLWETTGSFDRPDNPGTLHAFDAMDLSRELWNSNLNPVHDQLGGFAKFANPLVANGRVYVPTFSNQVAVYGLLAASPAPGARIDFIANAANYLTGPIAPGEVVAIFGAGLGPAVKQDTQVDANSRIATQVGCTQVLFDGVPAPLVSASESQVVAIVPFAVAGPNTSVSVKCGSAIIGPVSLPVASAAPALFSVSGAPFGQGAILNEDGALNSPDNPAPAGSVVTMYATGLGVTNPAAQDGLISGDVTPEPALHIAVFMQGVPADLLYAGAAPQTVAGVYQLNVLVPVGGHSGDLIPISVQAGNAISPQNITLAVR